MAKKRPTVEERKYMSKVASFGCIACEKDGLDDIPAEIHHVRKHTGIGLRPSNFDVLPLCASHHRTGKISVHLGKKAFIKRYGSEQTLMKQMRERMKKWDQLIADIF